MEAARILATLINAMVVDGQRYVTAAVRALELSQPSSIRRPPGDAIVSPRGADPGDTWDRHRVDPSFGEQLLRGESQKELRIWLPVEHVGRMVIATVGRRSGRSWQATVFGKPRCQVVVDWAWAFALFVRQVTSATS
jgi:hypothetical protein